MTSLEIIYFFQMRKMRAKQGLNWSWNALMRILLNRFPQVRPQTRSKDSDPTLQRADQNV